MALRAAVTSPDKLASIYPGRAFLSRKI